MYWPMFIFNINLQHKEMDGIKIPQIWLKRNVTKIYTGWDILQGILHIHAIPVMEFFVTYRPAYVLMLW